MEGFHPIIDLNDNFEDIDTDSLGSQCSSPMSLCDDLDQTELFQAEKEMWDFLCDNQASPVNNMFNHQNSPSVPSNPPSPYCQAYQPFDVSHPPSPVSQYQTLEASYRSQSPINMMAFNNQSPNHLSMYGSPPSPPVNEIHMYQAHNGYSNATSPSEPLIHQLQSATKYSNPLSPRDCSPLVWQLQSSNDYNAPEPYHPDPLHMDARKYTPPHPAYQHPTSTFDPQCVYRAHGSPPGQHVPTSQTNGNNIRIDFEQLLKYNLRESSEETSINAFDDQLNRILKNGDAPTELMLPQANNCTEEQELEFLEETPATAAEEKVTAPKQKRSLERKYPNGKPRLYKFLLEMLEKKESCIAWLDKDNGVFKIQNSADIAHRWGLRKKKTAMKYENFARSLRTYIKKGILTKPKTKLVYCFAKHVIQDL